VQCSEIFRVASENSIYWLAGSPNQNMIAEWSQSCGILFFRMLLAPDIRRRPVAIDYLQSSASAASMAAKSSTGRTGFGK
jgi:hypothetical protein